jgi:high-affinity Fe2+/Pb2+ permease
LDWEAKMQNLVAVVVLVVVLVVVVVVLLLLLRTKCFPRPLRPRLPSQRNRGTGR